ncbi:hypothetical protein [Pelomonas aquatica]|jgi:hypothetical protein|uniref:Uncharacterized protein n=2 Tax=Pseudomonadota TaxID=1224 RepID=A0A9X4LLT9_9BURK|nr:hypothetical protein [Pelomonas aquatica]MCY4757377.1 hypothetical protein [Pelomonas aquatica]MDG0865326.1 hypothetical protein [Pelomonas aquatica]
MTVETKDRNELFDKAELTSPGSATSERIVFRLLIADAGPEATAKGAWAPKALCSRAIRVLGRAAASARRHISTSSRIPKRHIHPMLLTAEAGCFIGLIVLDFRSLTPAKLELARVAGSKLTDVLMVGIRHQCDWSATGTATAMPNGPTEAPGQTVEQMRIAEHFLAALEKAANTADSGELRVKSMLPGQEADEPLLVKATNVKPATHSETEPWQLVARLESMVNKEVMRVRRHDDHRPIRVVITGVPAARIDFRLLQGTGPVILQVSGRVDDSLAEEPTVRLISMEGLDIEHWESCADWIENLASHLDTHRRTLEAAGLLPGKPAWAESGSSTR